MLTRRQLAATAAALAFLPVLPAALARAEDDPEMRMVESAKSPADHAALADHYRAEARKARARQEHHRLMAQVYRGKQLTGNGVHCRRLAKKFGEIADEFEGLASSHEKLVGSPS